MTVDQLIERLKQHAGQVPPLEVDNVTDSIDVVKPGKKYLEVVESINWEEE